MLLELLAHPENNLWADSDARRRGRQPGQSLVGFKLRGPTLSHCRQWLACIVRTRTICIVVGSLFPVSSSTVWWKGEIPENSSWLLSWIDLLKLILLFESKMIFIKFTGASAWSGQTLKPIRLQIIQGGVRVKSILHSAPGTWVKIPEIRNLKNYNNTQGQTNLYYLVSSLKTRLAYDWGTSQVSVAWELWWKTDIQVRHAKGVCPRGSLWQTLGIASVWTPIGQHTSLRPREINK